MRNLLVASFLVCFAHAPGGGVKMEVPPVKIRDVVQGVYEVRKSGGQIGREDFIRTYSTNNTVTYESVFEVVEDEGIVVSGNNKLEVEEDTGFPRSYYTHRRTRNSSGETEREVSVKMYSNVAVIADRKDAEENRKILRLPAGSLFVEGNIAHHLYEVLDRYDKAAGGKQDFGAFDPLGFGTTDVSLELAGDSTFAGAGKGSGVSFLHGQLTHYRYSTGAAFAADIFVDPDGEIAWIDAGPAGLEYLLVSSRRRAGQGSPAK